MEDEKKWRKDVEDQLKQLRNDFNFLKLEVRNKAKLPFRAVKISKPSWNSSRTPPPSPHPKKRSTDDLDVKDLRSDAVIPKVALFENFQLKRFIGQTEKEVLRYIFSSADPGEVIAKTEICSMTRTDFFYLGPGTQLETGVISMVSQLLTVHERLTAKKSDTINWYLPARLFNHQMNCPEQSPISDGWKKWKYEENYMGNLQQCNEIFIPVLYDKHYILARVMVKDKTVEVWDSNSQNNVVVIQKPKIEQILRGLDSIVSDQMIFKKGNFNFSSFKIVHAKNVPQQTNSYDCGVFVMSFMLRACRCDARSFYFNSDDERCYIAEWIAFSKHNLNKEQLLNKIRL